MDYMCKRFHYEGVCIYEHIEGKMGGEGCKKGETLQLIGMKDLKLPVGLMFS